MKICLATILLLIGVNSHASRKGNGGDVVICSIDGRTTYELLDYYEGRMNYQVEVNLLGETVLKKVLNTFKVLESKGKEASRGREYKRLAKLFENETEFVREDLIDIPDHGDVYLEDHCYIKQAIVQYPDYDNDKRRYVIDERIWENLSDSQKAGFIIHEIIYNELVGAGYEDSVLARRLTFKLSIGDLSNSSLDSSIYGKNSFLAKKCQYTRRDFLDVLDEIDTEIAKKACIQEFFRSSSKEKWKKLNEKTSSLSSKDLHRLIELIVEMNLVNKSFVKTFIFGIGSISLNGFNFQNLDYKKEEIRIFIEELENIYFSYNNDNFKEKIYPLGVLAQFKVNGLSERFKKDVWENYENLEQALMKRFNRYNHQILPRIYYRYTASASSVILRSYGEKSLEKIKSSFDSFKMFYSNPFREFRGYNELYKRYYASHARSSYFTDLIKNKKIRNFYKKLIIQEGRDFWLGRKKVFYTANFVELTASYPNEHLNEMREFFNNNFDQILLKSEVMGRDLVINISDDFRNKIYTAWDNLLLSPYKRIFYQKVQRIPFGTNRLGCLFRYFARRPEELPRLFDHFLKRAEAEGGDGLYGLSEARNINESQAEQIVVYLYSKYKLSNYEKKAVLIAIGRAKSLNKVTITHLERLSQTSQNEVVREGALKILKNL